MSGENIVVVGTTKTIESNGLLIANNSLQSAQGDYYTVLTDGGGYPDAEFVLTGTFAVAPTEGGILALYAQPMNVDGTLDTEVPEATRPTMLIGFFIVNNVTTQQTLLLSGGFARDLPLAGTYYIHNNGTGQSLQAGWTLKVTPRTNKAAP